MKNLRFLRLFLRNKNCRNFEFLRIKYLGKGLSYWKMSTVWNYGPLKLLLHFIEYRLDQLNNSSKLDNTIFWKAPLKEMSCKSLKFFGQPTTKWRPCKIFQKLNGKHLLMANIFKLHKYQIFSFMKMHNMSKFWFANNKFSLRKSLIYH